MCPRERPSPCTRWAQEVIALSLPGEGLQSAGLTLQDRAHVGTPAQDPVPGFEKGEMWALPTERPAPWGARACLRCWVSSWPLATGNC